MNSRLVRSNFAYFSLILAGVRPCGRVAPVTFPDSSTAEQSTVNRQVLGSNPSQGAGFSQASLRLIIYTENTNKEIRKVQG